MCALIGSILVAGIAGLPSRDISIDMAYWHNQGGQHCLQAKVSNQKRPELIFEYQLEHLHGEAWMICYVEVLCAVHRSVWRIPGQRFALQSFGDQYMHDYRLVVEKKREFSNSTMRKCRNMGCSSCPSWPIRLSRYQFLHTHFHMAMPF